MCLLHVLNSLKEKYDLKIICAHVNHGLREESKKEAEFVKAYCEKNSLVFEYFAIDSYKNMMHIQAYHIITVYPL